MKCFEIRFDNGNVMFVRSASLMQDIQRAINLSGGGCQVNMADIGDEIIAPVRHDTSRDEPTEGVAENIKVPPDWRHR